MGFEWVVIRNSQYWDKKTESWLSDIMKATVYPDRSKAQKVVDWVGQSGVYAAKRVKVGNRVVAMRG